MVAWLLTEPGENFSIKEIVYHRLKTDEDVVGTSEIFRDNNFLSFHSYELACEEKHNFFNQVQYIKILCRFLFPILEYAD